MKVVEVRAKDLIVGDVFWNHKKEAEETCDSTMHVIGEDNKVFWANDPREQCDLLGTVESYEKLTEGVFVWRD